MVENLLRCQYYKRTIMKSAEIARKAYTTVFFTAVRNTRENTT